MQIGGMYTIDFAKVSDIPKFNVNIKTGDSKRVLKLILLENNIALNLNDYTIAVAAKKEDHTSIFNDVTVKYADEGICELELTRQMLISDDDLKCEIVLYGSNGEVAKSSSFIINKVPSILNEEDLLSSNEFTALDKALVNVTYVKSQLSNKRDKTTKITSSDTENLNINNFDEPTRALIQNMKPGEINAVLGNGNVKTENYANESVTWDKLGFATGTIAFTTKNISIQEMSNRTLKVILEDQTEYKNSFYLYGFDGQSKTVVKTGENTSEYVIPNWNSLVLDFETKTIYVHDGVDKRTEKSIVLLNNADGDVSGGLLTQKYSILSYAESKNLILNKVNDVVIKDSFDVDIKKENLDVIVTLKSNNPTYKLSMWAYNKLGDTIKNLTLDETEKVYTIPVWNNLVWDIDKNQIVVKPDNGKTLGNCLLLCGNAFNSISDGYLVNKFSFKTSLSNSNKILNKVNDIAIKDSFEVDITRNGQNMVVKLKTEDSIYKLSMWAYNLKGELIDNIKIDELEHTYTIPPWSKLLWNMVTREIIIKSDTDIINDSCLLLACNGAYKDGDSGYFIEKYSYSKAKLSCFNKIKSSVDLENSNSFIYYSDASNIYIKFEDSIKITHDYKVITKTYNEIKEQIKLISNGYYVRKSPEWVDDCIFLPKGYSLIYKIEDGKFDIKNFGYQASTDRDILLINNSTGYIDGELATVALNKLVIDNRLKTNHILPQYKEKVDKKTNEIISLLNEDTFSFAYSADMHVQEWCDGFLDQTYNVLNKVDDELNLDLIFNAGDSICYGKNEKYYGLGDLKSVVNKLKNKHKLIHLQGNHDYNSSNLTDDSKQRESWMIPKYEAYCVLGRHLQYDKNVVFGDKTRMYFYKDFNDKKIRLICLNSSDVDWIWADDNDGKGKYLKYDPMISAGFKQDQLEWFANTALNFEDKSDKSEWHTIISCHIPPYHNGEHGMDFNGPMIVNDKQYRQILKCFKEGTSSNITYTDTDFENIFTLNFNIDFTRQGSMTLIGTFCGHVHVDHLIHDNDIDAYTVAIQAGYPDYTIETHPKGGKRIPYSYSEFALDIVLIDKTSKTVKLKRYGAGEDRLFNY